jgi:hypothetical protein
MPKTTQAAKATKKATKTARAFDIDTPALPFPDIAVRDIDVARPPWLDDILVPWRTCAQRILVVADGGLDFNESNQFGLTRFLLAMETAMPFGLKPVIQIAHRSNNPAAASAAMKAKFTFHPGFTFATGASGAALMNGSARRFDQIWLFGISGTPISDNEVRVLASFMAARGGVFATGDHETLGIGMSGRLPRVRKMRDWSGVPMNGFDRIDTVNQPSPDGLWNFDSQSDTLAQRIFPHFEQTSPGVYVAHPLLRYGASGSFQTGVIDRLPDHPHESRCLAGYDLSDPYTLVTGVEPVEFPTLPGVSAPFAPQIVATSVSGGRISEKGPVTPKCFGAISAYDGHRVNLGRIVCDATWHHFVNINLDGTGSPRKGLRVQVSLPPPFPPLLLPNADLLKIHQYYRNIAEWVGPVRRCRWFLDLVVARFQFPLLEELPRPLPPRPRWPDLLGIGALVEQALDARSGRGTAVDVVRELLADQPRAMAMLEGGGAAAAGDTDGPASLVSAADLARGLMGAMAHAVFGRLPDDPWQLREQFESAKDPDAEAERTMAAGLKAGLQLAHEHYRAAAQATLKALG